MSWWKAALGYAASAYVKDVLVRPEQMARIARAYCQQVRKPLLNVGAGTPASSLRSFVIGPTLWGDVNIDIAAPRVAHGPDRVSYGDARDLREWPDGHFGAVIASHVLEHLDRPDLALAEWERVADKVFVVAPSWWAPHTWLHLGHRWFIDPSLSKAYPIWTNRNKVYLLRVSDSGYRSARCQTTSPSRQNLPSPPRPSMPEMASKPQLAENPDIESSNSVTALTVVSGPRRGTS